MISGAVGPTTKNQLPLQNDKAVTANPLYNTLSLSTFYAVSVYFITYWYYVTSDIS